MNAYTPLTNKDISRMMRMPAVCDQPYTDISNVIPRMLPKASFATLISIVYKWGYLQGKKDIANWHGQQVRS